MPPLRKKGRGGGGGKTEAPLPGEVAGTSPSVSASLARKEKERRVASTATTTTTTSTSSQGGIENLGLYVSRSFQKERGEKKLLEASRTSLHLTSGTFQRSLRGRRGEASSTDSTPRVVLTDASARREERERRLASSNPAGYRTSSACRGGRDREEPAVCRTSCRDLGEEKILYRRSVRAGSSSEEKMGRRVGGRREEKSVDYSARYNSLYPGISSATGVGKGLRESQSTDGGSLKSYSISQRLDRRGGGDAAADLNHHLLKASPISPALLRKSPRSTATSVSEAAVNNAAIISSTSPVVTLPVKSSCKCGTFRSSDSSPGLMGVRGHSPLPAPTSARKSEGRERKSRELVESSSQGTPILRASTHFSNSGSSASRGNTPNLLQGRLALLEGRVTQIAAELKATKDLLDANNPACSKAVLSDIQLKITGIEKAINYRLARECGLVDQLEGEQLKGTYIQANDAGGRQVVHSELKSIKRSGGRGSSGSEIVPHGHGMYGKVSKSVHSSKALTKSSAPAATAYDGSSLSRISAFGAPSSRTSNKDHQPGIFECLGEGLYADDVGGSAPSSQVKQAFDHNEFEERLYPHQKLLRTRPSVHQKLMENRAALHQKLVENSVLLRDKLAALEERDGVNLAVDDQGAAEFISSLKQMQSHPGSGSRLDREFERRRAVKGDGFLEYDGEMLPTILRERRSSREGRRSSGSRKSFSGTSSSEPKSSEFVFHPVEKGSSGGRSERRRRSSEKRKSISTSDAYSPEPIQGASQIVMLEPTAKPLPCPPQATLTAPNETAVVDLECTETFPDEILYVKESSSSAEPLKVANDENISPPTIINLGCEESLSSGDATDDLPDYPLPPNDEDEEQPYLAECEDNVPAERLHQVGDKVATAGWFISDGAGILLAHDDGSCSFYDVANMEGKANFKGPPNLPSRMWRDCWLVQAAGSDGTCNKYVVAVSVGSAVDSAFCSWDFYERRITAFHSESSSPQASPSSFSCRSSGSSSPERHHFMSRDRQKSGFSWYSGSENAQLLKGRTRTPSGPLSLDLVSGGSFQSDSENLDIPLWWYRPCSPLIASAGSGLKTVTLYDVRDGDIVMKWELSRWVACMEFSSPIQWQNKDKLVVAEDQSISLWDVNSLTPQRISTINLSGKELRAMHVRNTDAEFSGGIRQRVSSQDPLSGHVVLCTQDALNVLDFRVPAGIALKIPTFGEAAHSVSANGDSIFAGVTISDKSKGTVQTRVNEWSMKQGQPVSIYKFPESLAHQTHQSVAQVWGDSNTVMGVNGNGLFMFDTAKGALPGRGGGQSVKEVLGTDDLVHPTFDHSGNKVLLVSGNKPASWCHWP